MSDLSGAELVQGRIDERDDLVAYLTRRLTNAATMAGRVADSDPDFALYRDRQRQLQVMIDEISHGLHVGEVAVAARLALGEVTDGTGRD